MNKMIGALALTALISAGYAATSALSSSTPPIGPQASAQGNGNIPQPSDSKSGAAVRPGSCFFCPTPAPTPAATPPCYNPNQFGPGNPAPYWLRPCPTGSGTVSSSTGS